MRRAGRRCGVVRGRLAAAPAFLTRPADQPADHRHRAQHVVAVAFRLRLEILLDRPLLHPFAPDIERAVRRARQIFHLASDLHRNRIVVLFQHLAGRPVAASRGLASLREFLWRGRQAARCRAIDPLVPAPVHRAHVLDILDPVALDHPLALVFVETHSDQLLLPTTPREQLGGQQLDVGARAAFIVEHDEQPRPQQLRLQDHPAQAFGIRKVGLDRADAGHRRTPEGWFGARWFGKCLGRCPRLKAGGTGI